MTNDQQRRRNILRFGIVFGAGLTGGLTLAGLPDLLDGSTTESETTHPTNLFTYDVEFELEAGSEKAFLKEHSLYRLRYATDAWDTEGINYTEELVISDKFDQPTTSKFTTEQSEGTYRWEFTTFEHGGDELRFRLYDNESIDLDLMDGTVDARDGDIAYTSDTDGPFHPPSQETTTTAGAKR